MGLSRLSKRCGECPFVDTCEHKRIEALAYIKPSVSALVPDLAAQSTAPRIRGNDFINIKIGTDTVVSLEREDIKRQLSKAIYGNSFKI